MEYDFLICKSCVYRLYTKDNHFKCFKNHDNTNINFHCIDFISEEIYLDRKSLLKGNDINKNKVLIFFLILAVYKIIVLVHGLFEIIDDDTIDLGMLFIAFLFVIVDFAFYYFLYKGNKLARRLGIFFLKFALLIDVITFAIDINFENFFSIIYCTIILYFIKYNKNYLNYFYKKNNLLNE